ncbi:MAG: hypothetical protein ACYC2R_03345 [Burkholderiales bacterium]
MHCQVIIPGLIFSSDQLQGTLPWSGLDLSALPWLLGRGACRPQAQQSWEEALCRAFGVERQHDWPVAPLTLLADGGAPAGDYWLRADPVHWSLQGDRMVLADDKRLALAQAEADAMIETLNRQFTDEGLLFLAPTPERWYIRLAQTPSLSTVPPSRAAGRPVDAFLPTGTAAAHWRGLLSEIQMLLHAHPVNQHRAERGETEINSLWLWGGGRLPEIAPQGLQALAANDPLALGLARAGRVERVYGAADADFFAATGNTLAVLDALALPARRGDLEAWQEALLTLENDWLQALRHALQQKTIQTLELCLPGASHSLRCTLGHRDAWRFWRRPSFAPLR